MPHALAPILTATAAWAGALAGIAWIAPLLLGRALGLGELLAAAAVLLVLIVVVLQARRQRQRRKIDDMRDSALW